MAQLIDKDVLVTKIQKRLLPTVIPQGTNYDEFEEGADNERIKILSLINTLEVKEVDLGKEIELIKGDYEQVDVAWNNDFDYIARHFFELGLKANQENNVIGTLEREVKIDAGGYPYIECDIELYDYDKDIPLAKEGDKVKIVVTKGK